MFAAHATTMFAAHATTMFAALATMEHTIVNQEPTEHTTVQQALRTANFESMAPVYHGHIPQGLVMRIRGQHVLRIPITATAAMFPITATAAMPPIIATAAMSPITATAEHTTQHPVVLAILNTLK
jgi:hypothetical protein